jgi:DNA repair photolyase
VELRGIQAKSIVNVHKHADGPWFWNRYSARPYVGCRSGCEFCFYRGGVYLGRRDPNSFDELIDVKENAVELLDKALGKLAPDVINCGDWQEPAESRFGLSRKMLEVVLARGFPLLVIERSPLLERDIDLLQEIAKKSWVGVILSLSSVDPALKRAFEPRSPDVKHRLQLLTRLRDAGLLAGVSLMPILPLCGDDEAHLDETIRVVKDHGAQFVIGGGLTMSGEQGARTLAAAGRVDESLPSRLKVLYGSASSPPRQYAAGIGRLVRELCQRHQIADRMPRYLPPGPLGENRAVAEKLFLRAYELELEEAASQRIWAYRKAAWTVDDWPVPLRSLESLQSLPGIGSSLAAQIGKWLG